MPRVRKSIAFSGKNESDKELFKFALDNCNDNFNEYIKGLIRQEKTERRGYRKIKQVEGTLEKQDPLR